MRSRKLPAVLAISCIFLQLTQVINAACVCNTDGVDQCAACNERLIVRPKPKPLLPKPELPLPPIGDNCWCSKMMIQPAALPKTPCSKHKLPSAPPAMYYPQMNYVPPSPPKDASLPADPVSLSLALQAGEALAVPESKLAFGFVKKPIDGLQKVYFSNVPEENLFKLNSEVITLRKRTYVPPKEEEEELEPEEEEAPPPDEALPYLTYKELGYLPEKFKNPKFRAVHPSYVIYQNPKPLPPKPHNCGFKPGRIASYCYEHS